MKIQVVKDRNGKLIATYQRATGRGLSVEPVLTPDQTVVEMDVPDNFRENLKAFYEQHQ
jgi:hypothetical protein